MICEYHETPQDTVFYPRVTPSLAQNTFPEHPQAVHSAVRNQIHSATAYDFVGETLHCNMFRFLENHVLGENVNHPYIKHERNQNNNVRCVWKYRVSTLPYFQPLCLIFTPLYTFIFPRVLYHPSSHLKFALIRPSILSPPYPNVQF